ncbi:MAG: hypothetical protein ACI4PF_02405 [Christensenellales bacterium]
MKLWVRNQTKNSLLQIDNICFAENIEHKWNIVTYLGQDRIVLGVYGTQQRALEVLDEIQKLLIDNDFVVINDNRFSCEELQRIYDIVNAPLIKTNGDAIVHKKNNIVFEIPLE